MESGPAATNERDLMAATAAFSHAPPADNRSAGVVARRVDAGGTAARPNGSAALAGSVRPLTTFRNVRPVSTLARLVESEVDRGIGFLLVPVWMTLGALSYFNLAGEPALLPIGLGLAALWLLRMATVSRPLTTSVISAALCCLVGFGFAKLETWRHQTRVLGADISTKLTGDVLAIEHLANGRVRLTLDVVATERPVLRYAPERVRVSARSVPENVRVGSRVGGIVRLLPPSGPLRPGSYDFSFQSYFDGLGASGFFLKGPELVGDVDSAGMAARFVAFVENARLVIAERVRQRIGGPEGEIAAALLVGVRAGIPETVNEALRKSGLYHVISISGLHMALVAGTLMGALRLGFACFPGFSSRFPVKKYAALAALAGTAGYLFFSGGEVAAQRSFIMLAVMLVALLFDRAALTMRNLAIAAIFVIVMSPHEVTGPSFQMSFAAAGALVGAYGIWKDVRERRLSGRSLQRHGPILSAARWAAFALAGLAATSVIAGLATAIFGAWHFQRVSPLSLVANLAAMPIVSLIVMPAAVAAALLMPFGLDGPFLDAMGAGLRIMNTIADWTALRSPLDAVGLVPASSVILLALALLVATVATTRLRLAALPLALAGCLLLPMRQLPDVLIAEDGLLMAVALGEGRLAVNRSRPNAFRLEDWQRALQAERVEKPVEGHFAVDSGGAAAFHCADGLCLARTASGEVIAHATKAEAATEACGIAVLIVILDPSAKSPCERTGAFVITGRDLARRGAASAILSDSTEGGRYRPDITYAVGTPYRPWHEHRRFSRAARGLPPYQAKKTQAAGSEKAQAGASDAPAEIPVATPQSDQ